MKNLFTRVPDAMATDGLSERYLLVSASYIAIASSRQTFANFFAASLEPPELVDGKAGHEIQKITADPMVVQTAGRSGYIPCLADVSFSAMPKGKKGKFFTKSVILHEKTAGAWGEFLAQLRGEKPAKGKSRPDADVIPMPAAAGGKP